MSRRSARACRLPGPRGLWRAVGPALALGLALGLAGCLEPRAGGGSEATNGNIVAGNLQYADGRPVMQARIWVRPEEYLSDTANADGVEPAPDATVDAEGGFVLKSLPAGTYWLEARDEAGNGVLRRFHAVQDEEVKLSADTLLPLGTLEGRLERLGNVPQRAYARLFGLERVARADSTGLFSIADLPAGPYRIQGVSSLPGHGFQMAAPVLIYPNGLTQVPTLSLIRSADEDYSQWPFARQLSLPADAVPAGDTLFDFPLLIRLHAGNFDFTQSTGSDIRLAGADGRHLDYEVERYDAVTRQAEIWVRLDTIPGGAALPLTLHWGRLQAPDFSFGPAVFADFGGAWHLQDAPTLLGELSALDASPAAARLTGRVEASDRSGAVASGAGFRGTHALTAAGHPGLWPETRFTFSAWIRVVDLEPVGAGILSLGDNYILRLEPTGLVRCFYYNDTLTLSEPLLGPWVDATASQSVDDGLWHMVAGVLSEDSLRIYIDGMPRGAERARGPVTYTRGSEFYLGLHGGLENGFRFAGQIDEVRIAGRDRSPAWMALAYRTQRPGSNTVIFR